MSNEPEAASIKMSDTEKQLSNDITPEDVEAAGSWEKLADYPDTRTENDQNKSSLQMVSDKPTVHDEEEVICGKSEEDANSESMGLVVKDTEATLKENKEHLVNDSNLTVEKTSPNKDVGTESEVSNVEGNSDGIATNITTSFQQEADIPDEFPNSDSTIQHQEGHTINEIHDKKQIADSNIGNIEVTTTASPSFDNERVVVQAEEGTTDTKVERQTAQLARDELCTLEDETEAHRNPDRRHDQSFLKREEDKGNACEGPAITHDTAEIADKDVLSAIGAEVNATAIAVTGTKECTTTHEESRDKNSVLRNDSVNLEAPLVSEAVRYVVSNKEFGINDAEIAKEKAEEERLADNPDTSENYQKKNLPPVSENAKDEQGSSTDINNLYTTHLTNDRNIPMDIGKPAEIAEESSSSSKAEQITEEMPKHREDSAEEVELEEHMGRQVIEITETTDRSETVTIAKGEDEEYTYIHDVSKYENGTDKVNLETEIESDRAPVGILRCSTNEKDGTPLLHEGASQKEGESLEQVPNECINETQASEVVDPMYQQPEDSSKTSLYQNAIENANLQSLVSEETTPPGSGEDIDRNTTADKERLKNYIEECSESLQSEDISGNTDGAKATVIGTKGNTNDIDLSRPVNDRKRPKESNELEEAANQGTSPLDASKRIEHVLESEERVKLEIYLAPEETEDLAVSSENDNSITFAKDKRSKEMSEDIFKEEGEEENSTSVYDISKNKDPAEKITLNKEIKSTEAEVQPENSNTKDVHSTFTLHEGMRQNCGESLQVLEEECIGETHVLDIVKYMPQQEKDSTHILQQQIAPNNAKDIKSGDPGEDVDTITGAEEANPRNNYNISNENGPEKDFLLTISGKRVESEEVFIEASSSQDSSLCATKFMSEGNIGIGDNSINMAEENMGKKEVTETLDYTETHVGDTETNFVQLDEQKNMKAEDYMFSNIVETEASNEIIETCTAETCDGQIANLEKEFEKRGTEDKSTTLGISNDPNQVKEDISLLDLTEKTGCVMEESEALIRSVNNIHNPHSASEIIGQERLAELAGSSHCNIDIKKDSDHQKIELGDILLQQENTGSEMSDISIARKETETAVSSENVDTSSIKVDTPGNLTERVTEKMQESKDTINEDFNKNDYLNEKGSPQTKVSKMINHADADVESQNNYEYYLSDMKSEDKEIGKVESDELVQISEDGIKYTGDHVVLDGAPKDDDGPDQISGQQNKQERIDSGEFVASRGVETTVPSENVETVATVKEENLIKEEIILVKGNENSFVSDHETGYDGNSEKKNQESDFPRTDPKDICITNSKYEERVEEQAKEQNQNLNFKVEIKTPERTAEDANSECSSSEGEAVNEMTSDSRESLKEITELSGLDSEEKLIITGKSTQMIEETKKNEGDNDSETRQIETEGNKSDSSMNDIVPSEVSSTACSGHDEAENTSQVDNKKASTDDGSVLKNSEDGVERNDKREEEVYDISKIIGTEDIPGEQVFRGNFANSSLESPKEDNKNFLEDGKAAEKPNEGNVTNHFIGPITKAITKEFQGKEAENPNQEIYEVKTVIASESTEIDQNYGVPDFTNENTKLLKQVESLHGENYTVTLPETSAREAKGMDEFSVIAMERYNEFDGIVEAKEEGLAKKVEDEGKAENTDEVSQSSLVIPDEAVTQVSSDTMGRTISMEDEGPTKNLEESLGQESKEQIEVHNDTRVEIMNDKVFTTETEVVSTNVEKQHESADTQMTFSLTEDETISKISKGCKHSGVELEELKGGEKELAEQTEATGIQREPISENLKGDAETNKDLHALQSTEAESSTIISEITILNHDDPEDEDQNNSCDLAPQVECQETHKLERTASEEFGSDVKADKQMFKEKPTVKPEAKAQSYTDEADTAGSDRIQTEKVQDGVQDAVEIEEIKVIDKDLGIQELEEVEQLKPQNEKPMAHEAALHRAEEETHEKGSVLIHNSSTGEALEENIKEQTANKVDVPNVITECITAIEFPLKGNFDCSLLDEKPLDNSKTFSESRSLQTEKIMPRIGGDVTVSVEDEKAREVVENSIIISDVENAAENTSLQEQDMEDKWRGKKMAKEDLERYFIYSENEIEASSENVNKKSSEKYIETLEESFDSKVEEEKLTVMYNEKENVLQVKDTPLPDLIEKRDSEEVETDFPANDVIILDVPNSLERGAGQVKSENSMEVAPENNCGINFMESGDSMTQHIEDQNGKLRQQNRTENTKLKRASVHEDIESSVSNDDLRAEEPSKHFKSSQGKDAEVEEEGEPDVESYNHNVTSAKIIESPEGKLEGSEPLCSEYPEEKDSEEQTDKVNPMVEKQLIKDKEDINTETATRDKIFNKESLKAASITIVEESGEWIQKKELVDRGDQSYNVTHTASVPASATETKLTDCLLEDKFDEPTNITSQTDPSTAEIEGVICGEEDDSADKRNNSSEVVTQHLPVALQNVEEPLSTENPEAGKVIEGETTASDQPLKLKHKTDEAADVDALNETSSSLLLCKEQENSASMTKQNKKETYTNKDTTQNGIDHYLTTEKTCLQKDEDSNVFKVPKEEIHPKDADEKKDNAEVRDVVQSNEVSYPNKKFEGAREENSDSESRDVEKFEICQIASGVVSDSRYHDVERNGKVSQNLLTEKQIVDKTEEAIEEVSHVEYNDDHQETKGDKDQTTSLSPPDKVLEEELQNLPTPNRKENKPKRETRIEEIGKEERKKPEVLENDKMEDSFAMMRTKPCPQEGELTKLEISKVGMGITKDMSGDISYEDNVDSRNLDGTQATEPQNYPNIRNDYPSIEEEKSKPTGQKIEDSGLKLEKTEELPILEDIKNTENTLKEAVTSMEIDKYQCKKTDEANKPKENEVSNEEITRIATIIEESDTATGGKDINNILDPEENKNVNTAEMLRSTAEVLEKEKESQTHMVEIKEITSSADTNEITEDTQKLDNSHLVHEKNIPREATSTENAETLILTTSIKEVTNPLPADTLQQPGQVKLESETATEGENKVGEKKLTEINTSSHKTKADKESEVDEHESLISGSDVTGNVTYKDTHMKAGHKKSHNILADVGVKVKHSIRKVKQAMSCSANIGITESDM